MQVIAGLVQRRREVKGCMKNERDQVRNSWLLVCLGYTVHHTTCPGTRLR